MRRAVDAPLARVFALTLAAAAGALLLCVGASGATPPRVLAVEFDNDVNPVTQDFVEDAIARGEREHSAAVVIVMDTPGGLGSSMRNIVKRILAAKVPVVVYVAPGGSSADSAGAVIAMAADVLAMAPQTNIGSSTPITTGGQDFSKDLRRKVVNDAAAYIGELAREHGRNVQAAERMVRQASNLGARRALELNVADVIAPSLPALLERIDGERTTPKGFVLHTAGAQVEEVKLSGWKRLLDLLIDPNVIALMLSIGVIGLIVELWNPGLVLPGTVGAISLVVGLYGLQVLPVSAAGVLLMLLSAGLFVTDLLVTSHGALTAAGAVTFVLGSLLLFDPAGPAYQVSLPVAIGIAATVGLLMAFGVGKAAQARRRVPEVGVHRLVGGVGRVRPDGLVAVAGELWQARADDGEPLVPGAAVRVERVDEEGLRLVVGSDRQPEGS
jgi:membrane-bound serine protease (ClpP class)